MAEDHVDEGHDDRVEFARHANSEARTAAAEIAEYARKAIEARDVEQLLFALDAALVVLNDVVRINSTIADYLTTRSDNESTE